MGLNYPASDIPAQARALYKRNIFRIIADVRAPIVPIARLPDTDAAPLDLSMSTLRSVSPVHLEYLQNMGVGASLSISIIVDGRLWGLFACHHLTPRLPGFVERTTLELVGTMFSLMLATRERSEVFTYETKSLGVTDRLLSVLARDPARLRDAAWIGEVMSDAIPADGVGVQIDGQIVLSGLTPHPSEFQDLLTDLNWASTTEVFATDHIAAMTPAAVSYAERASGLLAIPLSRSPRDFVVLFRAQRLRTVRWAGHPLKPVETEATGTRLSPRKSFAAWSEQVKDRATPFTAAEIRVATAVRGTLLDIVLEMYGVAEEERKSVEDRRNLLISELNHRVRNILALIRGIISQTTRSDNGQDMMSSLDARIQSLARAHDQLTSDKLGTARLRALIDTEILAFAVDKRDRVRVTGPDIRLLPTASTIAVLIVHELVTNSTKYGALSAEGAIAIDWTIEGNGGLSLTWREIDGPSVTPPRRRGFGSSIIERSLPHELGGTAELRFRVTGVEADFTIPAEYIRYDIDPASFEDPADPALPIPLRPLAGKSVLLVEDSLIIAMDCETSIQELGARDVFLAATVADALAVLATRDFDFAVLDVNLGRENSMPIGEVLADRAIPFIFATGYGETTIIPPRLRDRGIIVKPYTRADLAREVTRPPR